MRPSPGSNGFEIVVFQLLVLLDSCPMSVRPPVSIKSGRTAQRLVHEEIFLLPAQGRERPSGRSCRNSGTPPWQPCRWVVSERQCGAPKNRARPVGDEDGWDTERRVDDEGGRRVPRPTNCALETYCDTAAGERRGVGPAARAACRELLPKRPDRPARQGVVPAVPVRAETSGSGPHRAPAPTGAYLRRCCRQLRVSAACVFPSCRAGPRRCACRDTYAWRHVQIPSSEVVRRTTSNFHSTGWGFMAASTILNLVMMTYSLD